MDVHVHVYVHEITSTITSTSTFTTTSTSTFTTTEDVYEHQNFIILAQHRYDAFKEIRPSFGPIRFSTVQASSTAPRSISVPVNLVVT